MLPQRVRTPSLGDPQHQGLLRGSQSHWQLGVPHDDPQLAKPSISLGLLCLFPQSQVRARHMKFPPKPGRPLHPLGRPNHNHLLDELGLLKVTESSAPLLSLVLEVCLQQVMRAPTGICPVYVLRAFVALLDHLPHDPLVRLEAFSLPPGRVQHLQQHLLATATERGQLRRRPAELRQGRHVWVRETRHHAAQAQLLPGGVHHGAAGPLHLRKGA